MPPRHLTSTGTASGRVGRRQLEQRGAGLSDRERAVLATLSTVRFATTRHIERLHTRPMAKTPVAAERAAQRDMAHLHRLGLVDRLERRIGGVRAGSAGIVWRLAPAGIRLGGHPRRRALEPGPTHLAHVLDVTELVTCLHESARTHALELLAVETEPDCWRPITHGRRRWLKPDLRITVGVADLELHWFVELDRGTEARGALRRKITTYIEAWHDGGEQARAGVFPRVLWVAPTGERVSYLEALFRRTPGVPAGMFIATPNESAVETLATIR